MNTSDPHTRITILGSGTCVPSLKRNPCAFVLETGSSKLLFDCGPGTMRRLLEAGITINEITHIFISHFHPDHTAEMVPFIFSSKYPLHARRMTPLILVAGKGFVRFFSQLKTVYHEWIELPDGLLNFFEMDNQEKDALVFDDFSVNSMPVNHRPESIAFRVTDRAGKSIVYSGDTDRCSSLSAIAKNADLFICESAFPDQLKSDGHLTPSLAGEAAHKANVKTLVLTHFYPECDQVDIVKQCRMAYKGRVVMAEDLMVLTP